MRQFGLAALMALAVSSAAVAQKTFTIGWSGAITGPTSDAGAKYALGIADYCKYANDAKLIPGWTVKCEVRDDNYDNAKTQRTLEDFAQNAKISAFLGYSTGGSLQVRGLLRELQMPSITASYHIGLLEGADGDYVFLPISSYSEQLVSLVEYLAKTNKAAKIALVVNPSPFGRLPAQDAKKAADMLGIQVVATDEVGGNNLDNTALLKRYESLGVTHVLHQNTYGPVSNILKDAKRLNLDKKFTQMGAHYAGGDDLIDLAGDAAEGFIWTTGFWLYDEADKEGMKLVRQMAAANKRGEKDASSIHYTAGAAATAIFLEAAKRAATAGQEVTNKSIYDALLGMNGSKAYRNPFTLTPVTYSKTDHTGSQSLRLLQVSKKKWRVLSAGVVSKLFQQIQPGR
jgi:branched-chain amino acid transport system substrate-binding protein